MHFGSKSYPIPRRLVFRKPRMVWKKRFCCICCEIGTFRSRWKLVGPPCEIYFWKTGSISCVEFQLEWLCSNSSSCRWDFKFPLKQKPSNGFAANQFYNLTHKFDAKSFRKSQLVTCWMELRRIGENFKKMLSRAFQSTAWWQVWIFRVNLAFSDPTVRLWCSLSWSPSWWVYLRS